VAGNLGRKVSKSKIRHNPVETNTKTKPLGRTRPLDIELFKAIVEHFLIPFSLTQPHLGPVLPFKAKALSHFTVKKLKAMRPDGLSH
jgi:hypothetical protein